MEDIHSGEELNGRRALDHKCEQRFFETVVCKSVDEYFFWVSSAGILAIHRGTDKKSL
jgi:hypothetical protein